MSFIKSKHIFAILMILALLVAFVLPHRDYLRADLAGLFTPISAPMLWIGQSIHTHLSHDVSADPRAPADIREENDQLKQTILNLTAELEDLRAIAADRKSVGKIGDYCTLFHAVGADSANRDTLMLAATLGDGLRERQAVLTTDGMVGQIVAAGLTSSRVRLLTDMGFKFQARFARIEQDKNGAAALTFTEEPKVLVSGIGKGQMIANSISVADTKNVKEGDWVLLDDPEWDSRVKYQRAGRVVSVGHLKTAILTAEIHISPVKNLMDLKDVLVLVK